LVKIKTIILVLLFIAEPKHKVTYIRAENK